MEINNYTTPNVEILKERSKLYNKKAISRTTNNRINYMKKYRDIPDDVEILEEYANVLALRSMYLTDDIILESIYIKHPELFEK